MSATQLTYYFPVLEYQLSKFITFPCYTETTYSPILTFRPPRLCQQTLTRGSRGNVARTSGTRSSRQSKKRSGNPGWNNADWTSPKNMLYYSSVIVWWDPRRLILTNFGSYSAKKRYVLYFTYLIPKHTRYRLLAQEHIILCNRTFSRINPLDRINWNTNARNWRNIRVTATSHSWKTRAWEDWPLLMILMPEDSR